MAVTDRDKLWEVPAVEAAAATAAPATPAELAPLPAEAASPPAGGAAAPSAGSASWLTFLGTATAWVGGAVLEAAAEGLRRAKRRRCEGEQREGGGGGEDEAPPFGSSGRARLGGPSADEAGGGGAPPAAPAAQAAVRTITAAGAEAVRQADREGLSLATGGSNSGYKGVTYCPKRKGSKKYQLMATVGGKSVFLGWFATAEQAALFYARREAGRDTSDLTAPPPPPPPPAPSSAAGADAVRQAGREGLSLATSSSSNSGYKGVYYCPKRKGSKRYELKESVGGKVASLGFFATAEQAALFRARREAGRDTS
ncbi:hypothetical protein EMIHUDRAFT_95783 [Emiliania huxleyi CCMP1516]|uniref:AP2/ERF domain-containing protein n=2 Tax=Emiliania huxleyi TaxID=2903 RepID=A0A0D3J351_EMIH1|nr:hypothetical protein EMIHUDRAFT_95783 [Emiliania huxleyi CCMP1516]EOD17936.1 hypothetical protein EMIHUDRAFT_95783 [Emiliania huxleyi CCMP1516]|eukprot:XP_005770365.1 hypothetical protein EMIHUDRAFT_95783 [Emiliania huxleyi CCMP1516]